MHEKDHAHPERLELLVQLRQRRFGHLQSTSMHAPNSGG